MKATQLGALAVLAVVSVAATAAVLRTGAPTIAADRRGEKVVPALLTKANDIDGITVRDGNDTLAVERHNYKFLAAESGWPVKTDAVRDLVAGSAELTFEEARTSDPARYGDLGLADPGTAGTAKDAAGVDAPVAGKEIVLRSGGSELADLVVGNRNSTVGGAAGGMFVRLKGQPHSFLARGNVRLPGTRSEWFVPVNLDVKRSEIKKIEITGGGRDTVSATAEKPGQFTLANVPEKHVADSFKVGRLATPIESFAFQDVRKATMPAADARRMVVDADDGLRLVLTSVGDITEGWVQIAAEATNNSKQDAAKAITAQVAGYDFRLPSNLAEILSWTTADLTEEQKS